MDEVFTLNQISRLLGAPHERVRYVIDQKLLPGQRHGQFSHPSVGRGRPRTYLAFEAFTIACATMMISAGLRRRSVKDCLYLLCQKEKGHNKPSRHVLDIQRMPLYQAFQKRDEAMLELGDHVNVRMYGSEDHRQHTLAYGWRQIETGATLTDYAPWVVIGINIAKVRACLEGPN